MPDPHGPPGLPPPLNQEQQQLLDQWQRTAAIELSEGEDLTNFNRSAAGIAYMLSNLRSEITGASGLPHTLLWGESPSGLGADTDQLAAAFRPFGIAAHRIVAVLERLIIQAERGSPIGRKRRARRARGRRRHA